MGAVGPHGGQEDGKRWTWVRTAGGKEVERDVCACLFWQSKGLYPHHDVKFKFALKMLIKAGNFCLIMVLVIMVMMMVMVMMIMMMVVSWVLLFLLCNKFNTNTN